MNTDTIFSYHFSVRTRKHIIYLFAEDVRRCTDCNRLYSDRNQLEKHIKLRHENYSVDTKKQFACNLCAYSTDNQGNFSKHQLKHSGVKAHKCEQCEKCFSQKSTLQGHIRSIHGNQKFACEFYKKTCNRKSNLTKHIATVHQGRKEFKCPQCNKMFGQNGSLTRHMRIHTNEK